MKTEAEILYRTFNKFYLLDSYNMASICYHLSRYANGDVTLQCCKDSIDSVFRLMLEKENERKERNNGWY